LQSSSQTSNLQVQKGERVTKQELIGAYVRGELDRRGFVGRLTALGVTATAAVAYAGSFAPGVAASSSRNEAGFLMSAQGTVNDDEYGTAFSFASDEEAVTVALESVAAVLAVLGALGGFSADDFDPGVFDVLTTIQEQQAEHADALAALLGDTPVETPPADSFGSADDFLASLAGALDDLVGTYAAVAPALESGEARQTVTNILAVASRQAAVVAELAGLDPVPATFQEPALP
jgi:hypothetical protein